MWLMLALAACNTEQYTDCTPELGDCREVEGGRYLYVEPEDFSGQALIYFHGYGGSAKGQVGKSWVEEDLLPRGVLGIFPDGYDNTWSHEGSPSSDRDELAFLDAVLDDVRERWEVTILDASGFSQGASMGYDLACYRTGELRSFFPGSGTFWEPLPASCDGPMHIRHTHGTADSTFPLEGRAIGLQQQGDTYEGLALWRSVNGCSEEADREEVQGEVTCQVWESCSSGREIRLCLHDGGHSAPDDWMAQNLDWAGQR